MLGVYGCELKLANGSKKKGKMWNNLSHVSRPLHNSCQTGIRLLLLGYAGEGGGGIESDLLVNILIVRLHNFATFRRRKGCAKFYPPSFLSSLQLYIIHGTGIPLEHVPPAKLESASHICTLARHCAH